MSYADKVSLDICSNCHPFYTGKQKLIDTAGRVDRFKSMQQKASMAKEELNKRMAISKTKDKTKDDNQNKSTTGSESATDAKDISEK
jgi:large subunit ribosomal protein L31